MSMKLMVAAMQCIVGSPARKLVLIKLADNANDKGECFPSYKHIADQCEISKRSVIGHIQRLATDNFLVITHRKTPKGNSSNSYQLTLEGSADISLPPSANAAPPSEDSAPAPSADPAPRISHSFEPVSEPIKINKKYGFDFPEWVDVEAMDEWLSHRKKLRATNSPRALKSIMKDLEVIRQAGIDPNEAIETALKKGWKTVELEYLQKPGGHYAANQSNNSTVKKQPQQPSSYTDRLKDLHSSSQAASG